MNSNSATAISCLELLVLNGGDSFLKFEKFLNLIKLICSHLEIVS